MENQYFDIIIIDCRMWSDFGRRSLYHYVGSHRSTGLLRYLLVRAEDWISGMPLEKKSIERIITYKSYELFSDERYEQNSRLTEPYLYAFFCE